MAAVEVRVHAQRRRSWAPEDKLRIVRATLESGAAAKVVADRHGTASVPGCWALVRRGVWGGSSIRGWAVTVGGMPFEHNAARRHRIPKARYRVRNWREYEAGLKRRGDVTLWPEEAALAGWQAPHRITPGGQAWYSDAAIELMVIPRLVFHLALRQAEASPAACSGCSGGSCASRTTPP